MTRTLCLLVLLGGLAHAEEPLWTEGTRGATPPLGLQSFVKLARTLGPAVVNIVALSNIGGDAPEGQPSNGERPRRGRGQGTGFVIQKNGFILTNHHVVENADDIRVRFADEREMTAHLVGKDERTDIALLKVEATDLAVAPLGNSDDIQIGEWVVAIGNPFGLDHTVTIGIVSAKGRRDIRPSAESTGIYDFIQTDASINPGNSGGPLINTRGEVVGMNTAMNARAQGIGFAIPINMVKVIAPLLRQYGHAPRSWLGVHPQAVTGHLRRAFNLPEARGALLSDVVPDSPAQAAGLLPGDVILDYDGRALRRADDLTWLVATTPSGRKIALNIIRKGKPLKIEVVPVAATDEPKREARSPSKPDGKRSALGMTVSEISTAMAQELGNPKIFGVVVMSVEPDSPAVEAGVERGDIILRVGDSLVKVLDDYAGAVRKVPSKDLLRLLVKRDGKNLWVAFPKR